MALLVHVIWKINQMQKRFQSNDTGICLPVMFFFHVFGLKIVQSLMTASVGVAFYLENNHITNTKEIHISPFLWYQIAGALVLPFVGPYTFAVIHYFRLQEFLVSFYSDVTHSAQYKLTESSVAVRNCYVLTSPCLQIINFIYVSLLLAFTASFIIRSEQASPSLFYIAIPLLLIHLITIVNSFIWIINILEMAAIIAVIIAILIIIAIVAIIAIPIIASVLPEVIGIGIVLIIFSPIIIPYLICYYCDKCANK